MQIITDWYTWYELHAIPLAQAGSIFLKGLYLTVLRSLIRRHTLKRSAGKLKSLHWHGVSIKVTSIVSLCTVTPVTQLYMNLYSGFLNVMVTYELTNIYVTNIYETNIYVTNIYVTNNQVTNIYVTNIYVTNIYVQNIYIKECVRYAYLYVTQQIST